MARNFDCLDLLHLLLLCVAVSCLTSNQGASCTSHQCNVNITDPCTLEETASLFQSKLRRNRAEAPPVATALAENQQNQSYRHGQRHVTSAHTSVNLNLLTNIVLIKVQYGSYNKLVPWQTMMGSIQPGLKMMSESVSSGLILEHGLILTPAYVAVDSVAISVQRQGKNKRYPATIVSVATELDLALINVSVPEFWHADDPLVNITSSEQIMSLGTAVTLPAFPKAGDLSISLLESSVAGIKTDNIGTSIRYGSFPRAVLTLYPEVNQLVSQAEAVSKAEAGGGFVVGPVFSKHNGKLEGFIGRSGAVIPLMTLSNFVNTYKRDNVWSGLGTLGMITRSMEAIALRMYWGLPDDDLGVQVRSVCKDSPLYNKVKRGDVLVEIDGEPIMANGAIRYRKSKDHKVMLPFEVLLGEKEPGATTTFNVFRYGSSTSESDTFSVSVSLDFLPALIPRAIDEVRMQQPTYFILGGLVWTVLTEGLMTASQEQQQGLSIPTATLLQAVYRWREDPDEELVMLLSRLEHPCNRFYGSTGSILESFNGKTVKNMKQFVKMAGQELNDGVEFLQFAFMPGIDADTKGGPDDPDIVLDVDLCWGADAQVLNTYQIKAATSTDLWAVYEEARLEDFAAGQAANGTWPEMLFEAEATLLSHSATAESSKLVIDGKSSSEAQRPLQNIPWFNVVQIHLDFSYQDFITPWKARESLSSRCSAIIVDQKKKLILTNSHCVGNARYLGISREDAPDPVEARVLEIAHDIDLAWITTDETSFWDQPQILPRVKMSKGLPTMASSVRVVGYPTGGQSISITQGIISRVDGQLYPNGLQPGDRNTPGNLLIVQVDAAINPGNSGGPVFDTEGNLLGLAFAGLSGAQNTGYVIPNIYCTNFIDSVHQSGRWQAQPELGFLFRSVQNPGMRKFLQLEDATGVQVRSVSKFSPLWGAGVRKGDVLVKVAGISITGTGMVVRNISNHQVSMPFDTLVTEKPVGEEIDIEFIRPWEGLRFNLRESFPPIPPLVPRFNDAPMGVSGREHFAAKPSYFMFYGLIFGIFSNPVYEQAWERKISVPWSLVKRASHTWLEDEQQEVVVLLHVLKHPCNAGYDLSVMRGLQYFNGKAVSNLEELMTMAIAAETQGEKFMRFTFTPTADAEAAGSRTDPDVVLHRDLCEHADRYLMEWHNIKSRSSQDFSNVTESEDTAQVALAQFTQQSVGEAQANAPHRDDEADAKSYERHRVTNSGGSGDSGGSGGSDGSGGSGGSGDSGGSGGSGTP